MISYHQTMKKFFYLKTADLLVKICWFDDRIEATGFMRL